MPARKAKSVEITDLSVVGKIATIFQDLGKKQKNDQEIDIPAMLFLQKLLRFIVSTLSNKTVRKDEYETLALHLTAYNEGCVGDLPVPTAESASLDYIGQYTAKDLSTIISQVAGQVDAIQKADERKKNTVAEEDKLGDRQQQVETQQEITVRLATLPNDAVLAMNRVVGEEAQQCKNLRVQAEKLALLQAAEVERRSQQTEQLNLGFDTSVTEFFQPDDAVDMDIVVATLSTILDLQRGGGRVITLSSKTGAVILNVSKYVDIRALKGDLITLVQGSRDQVLKAKSELEERIKKNPMCVITEDDVQKILSEKIDSFLNHRDQQGVVSTILCALCLRKAEESQNLALLQSVHQYARAQRGSMPATFESQVKNDPYIVAIHRSIDDLQTKAKDLSSRGHTTLATALSTLATALRTETKAFAELSKDDQKKEYSDYQAHCQKYVTMSSTNPEINQHRSKFGEFLGKWGLTFLKLVSSLGVSCLYSRVTTGSFFPPEKTSTQHRIDSVNSAITHSLRGG